MTQSDINRAPDWRWIEAKQRAKTAATASGKRDQLTDRVVTFLKLQDRAQTSAARARLDKKFPTISQAHGIRFGKNDEQRKAIEIRLLAGCSPGRIAELSALAPAVVWVYFAIFFDVLDRLDRGDFIWSQVICDRSGSDGSNEGMASRWLAWIGGPLAADTLLLPGHDFGIIERAKDVDSALIEVTESLVARAMALAPLLDRLAPDQVRQIMRWRIQARQQKEVNSGEVGQRGYLDNVRAFLDNLDFTIGRSTIPTDDNEKYFTSAAEPTAEEWAKINCGEPVPGFDDRVAMTASIRRNGEATDQTDELAND